MSRRLARYRKVAALAEQPTPLRRLAAAAAAGVVAFMLFHLLLGLFLGAAPTLLFFPSFAFAVAAAVAAATLKPVMAAVYGLLGAAWLFMECLVAALGCLAAGLG